MLFPVLSLVRSVIAVLFWGMELCLRLAVAIYLVPVTVRKLVEEEALLICMLRRI
jgi:hypothetical protein